MRKIKDAISRFMYGRYGGDNLNTALLWLYIAVVVINLFVRGNAKFIFWALGLVLVAIILLRCFSKNIYTRSAENRRYLKLKTKTSQFFSLLKARWRDRKTHVYRKCPHCKATLRLPKKKGEHRVDCPKCKKEFKVRI